MNKLGASLIAFFSINPDEELTINDIIIKWGAPNRQSVRRALLPYKGWIDVVKRPSPMKRSRDVLFYCAGPLLLNEVQPKGK